MKTKFYKNLFMKKFILLAVISIFGVILFYGIAHAT
jgi:hypothetical protein